MSLGETIVRACKSRGLSLSRACKRAGLNYSTLHSQIRKGREIPFRTVESLAATLNLPLAYFAEARPSLSVAPADAATDAEAESANALSERIAEHEAAASEAGQVIGTDDVLDWLMANDNRLQNHEWLINKLNLYYPCEPGETVPRPYWIGADSLSAKYYRLLETNTYEEVFLSFDPEVQQEILQAHTEVVNHPYLISDRKVDSELGGVRVSGTYRRLLAPVTDDTGQLFILLFSKLTHFPRR
ncbi:helix-turn-helix domain-containing protein [Marimonas lutisalis]|uniref:helix-turn-helix domain-containing protein n=1 Tax=Marimonas lutisalis TaxID=2545756 RepID=UPI0010F83BE1|nr:helix-turn-helix transcriptional regulator [Marimonas lutisalis]